MGREGGFISLSRPVDLDVPMRRREVTAMYASVAAAPEGTLHFHLIFSNPVSNRSSARPCCPQQPSSYVFACKAKNLGSDIASTRESSFVPHRSLVPMKDSIRIHRG
jgi:hypothetical protein